MGDWPDLKRQFTSTTAFSFATRAKQKTTDLL